MISQYWPLAAQTAAASRSVNSDSVSPPQSCPSAEAVMLLCCGEWGIRKLKSSASKFHSRQQTATILRHRREANPRTSMFML